MSDSLLDRFKKIRKKTLSLCEPLELEDFVVQPSDEVSPPKWHLAHTTWFFEELILKQINTEYTCFNADFSRLFNSYYKKAGEHWKQTERGALSRPTVKEVYEYREFVDQEILNNFNLIISTKEIARLFEVGLHHEQQHQELLLMDIKFILNCNPSKPKYLTSSHTPQSETLKSSSWIDFSGELYEFGQRSQDSSFCYDNETPAHKVYLHPFAVESELVSNQSYLEFIEAGGYQDSTLWMSDGWDWLQENRISAPLYWSKNQDEWYEYTFRGEEELALNSPVCHISYYEADAYARWKGARLPTEFELELFLRDQNRECDTLWQWSSSHYSAYPGFQKFVGFISEYNGKFMCNQFVLRGGCHSTPQDHYRYQYRNFYRPHQRWMFSGIRLAKDFL